MPFVSTVEKRYTLTPDIYIYIYIYIYMYACVYNIHIYTYTYIHTYNEHEQDRLEMKARWEGLAHEVTVAHQVKYTFSYTQQHV